MNKSFALNEDVMSNWPSRGVGSDCRGCIRVDAERDRTIGFFVAVFDRKPTNDDGGNDDLVDRKQDFFIQAFPSSASSSHRTSKQDITSSSGTGVEMVPAGEPVKKKRKKNKKKNKKNKPAETNTTLK